MEFNLPWNPLYFQRADERKGDRTADSDFMEE